MKRSERNPGYSYRRAGAQHMDEQSLTDVQKFNVSGDGERGIPVRQATSEDAEQARLQARKSNKNTNLE